MKIPFFDPYEEIFVEHLENRKKHNVPVQQYHDGYELYLLIDGERSLFFNDVCYTLKRGDLAVIRPFELHYAESGNSPFYERYVLNFNPDQLSVILSESDEKLLFHDFGSRLVHLDGEQFNAVLSSFRLIDSLISVKNPLSQKAVAGAVLSLIMYISRIKQSDLPVRAAGLSGDLISAVNYINTHYAETITLDMISDAAHISKYHFCRIFKKATGTTFLEYLTNVRLSHAHRLLMQTDLSTDKIAKKTGFGSAAYLSRVFKKVHGVPPGTLRKRA